MAEALRQSEANPIFMSLPEYLEFERRAQSKHEWHEGRLYPLGNPYGPMAMAGASTSHVRLTTAITALLFQQLRGTSCEPFAMDHRVKAPGDISFMYPDVFVAGEPEFSPNEFDTILNPIVIFEVLSPSTAEYDREEKFARYRTIPTLRDYVLISTARVGAEHRSRPQESERAAMGDRWWLRVLTRPEEELSLDSIGCTLRLSDLYERIQFSE
jgi:Uma2 family endonuclease